MADKQQEEKVRKLSGALGSLVSKSLHFTEETGCKMPAWKINAINMAVKNHIRRSITQMVERAKEAADKTCEE